MTRINAVLQSDPPLPSLIPPQYSLFLPCFSSFFPSSFPPSFLMPASHQSDLYFCGILIFLSLKRVYFCINGVLVKIGDPGDASVALHDTRAHTQPLVCPCNYYLFFLGGGVVVALVVYGVVPECQPSPFVVQACLINGRCPYLAHAAPAPFPPVLLFTRVC